MTEVGISIHDYLHSTLDVYKKQYGARVEELCSNFHNSMETLLQELVRDVLADVSAKLGPPTEVQYESNNLLEEAADVLEEQHIQLGEEPDTKPAAITLDDSTCPDWFSSQQHAVYPPIKEELPDPTVPEEPQPSPETPAYRPPRPPPAPLSQEAEGLLWRVNDTCFRCRQCWREFRVRRHAEQHVRIHTGERPFACHLCARAFTQRSTMYRHLREAHFRVRHIECPVCKKTFSRQLTMRRHLLTHYP